MKILLKYVLLIMLGITINSYRSYSQKVTEEVALCVENAGADATYLKDFDVQNSIVETVNKVPVARFSMMFSKNIIYRFTICNNESASHPMLQLFDMTTLLGSTYNASTGKEYQSFDFECQKTGVYHVLISFIDGRKGNAVGIISFVKTL
ncbi:MAG: hypothetical protein GYA16_01085 [Spirochaetes bacterium]|nr:hypothetical protein [Spirochaetota bacterium]